ncbi:hypothetical protein GSI_11976 [Ganoderma sinense ZZ0214-1]|uniref:Uncharacterized protein n=1 Tax=Ganoderma sinense ZZ0214-1 TaxID=1077348 RepID=A0A2G8RXH8_9APHY|nr:hypothetical protein GSI_11976 [Ganoderma sinense ZZ0214-1]
MASSPSPPPLFLSSVIDHSLLLVLSTRTMPWIPWSTSPPPRSQPQSPREYLDHYGTQLKSQLPDPLQKHWWDPQDLLAELGRHSPYILLALGAALGLAADRAYVRYLKRIPNSGWVTPDMLKSRRWIKGYVTRCSFSASCAQGARSLRPQTLNVER